MQYRYANATNQVDAANNARSAEEPYPDTRTLVDALYAQTPADLRYMVDDGFNRIVLYDNKAVSAVSQKLRMASIKSLSMFRPPRSKPTATVSNPLCPSPTIWISVSSLERRVMRSPFI
jgi:hypothetical protein